MAEKQYKASLSKGRSGWCVIFRHPLCKSADGRQQLRVRRGLGTRDEQEAERLIGQLNEILASSAYWNPTAKERAEAKFDPQIVGAFYDHISPEKRDGWSEREEVMPLPTKEEGYAKVQLVGTTGSGKTTVVRQIIGTDPKEERFPSISAAKTTLCDIELILAEGPFRAAVSFLPRDQIRQYIMECVIASVTAHLEYNPPNEVMRRFMEHSDMKFRLSYLLGNPKAPKSSEDEILEDDDDEDEDAFTEDAEVTTEEQKESAERLHEFIDAIEGIAVRYRDKIADNARELDIDLARASARERDILQEFVEEEMIQDDGFHTLVDEILDEVEARFEHVSTGTLNKGRDGWPRLWEYETEDRECFVRSVNRFSSNYAPNFGRLLTPLVEGIRAAGPFSPAWGEGELPKIVLLDGQGIGHTADSTSSISTRITTRFETADVILLVDNAAQPMQAGTNAVLGTLVSSGHESKLAMIFTHFDEVKGDNLRGNSEKMDHVTGSFFNAVQSIGKASGREAEQSLKRLIPDRLFFFSKIQKVLPKGSRFTRQEFSRLMDEIAKSILPPASVEYRPVYDIANLVLAIQKATQEFHDRWRGILSMGSRSGVAPEHWTRVKALTRRIGSMNEDEYGNLKPIADLILLIQHQVSRFLAEPLEWTPEHPPEDKESEKTQAIDEIRKEVFHRLHKLSRRRLIDEQLSGWVEAYEHRGTGSTKIRARDLVSIYETAAPVPDEMPRRDVYDFLIEVRELVGESVLEGKGGLRGWTREEELV